MNLDDVIRDLLAAPPGDFVNARSAAARDLRSNGEKALAAEVLKVRKPQLRVWAANRAAATRSDAARRLGDAADRLREVERRVAAGEKGVGADLRESAAEQRRQLDVLEAEARRLLENAGSSASAAAEAREILRLASREGGEAWRRLLAGILLEEPGAEQTSVFALAVEDLPARASAPPGASESKRRLEAEAAARDARAQAIALDRAARELEEEARAARRRADAAAVKAEELEAALRPG